MALLELPQPYDFELSMERFRVFGRDPATLWHEGTLYRVVGGVEVRIAAAPGGVDVEPLDGEIGAHVRLLLGAPFDLDGFRTHAARDPVLARFVAALPGFRPPLQPDPWEALVTSITAQQVSLHSAFAIRARFVERFGERAARAYAFPLRERVAAAAEDELVALGFSRRKAEYVTALARSGLDLGALAALPDEQVKRALVVQRGLGEWTADWFLARCLGRPRAWPAGDLGLRRAVERLYADGRELTIAEVRRMGERFAPYENLAAHYLLTGLRTVGS